MIAGILERLFSIMHAMNLLLWAKREENPCSCEVNEAWKSH